MPVFRINKIKDYTIMSNYHLKDKKISLKAKGLLTQMLSLPEEWDYSIQGLVAINKESEVAIKGALDELKEYRYLIVSKLMPNETKSGRIEYVYDIYESPKQEGGFLGLEFLGLENQVQYNTNNKYTNNKINNNNREIKERKFKPPTLEEVEEYIKEKDMNVNANTFYDYFNASNWVDSKGNKVKNWKQKLITWNSYGNKQPKEAEVPSWFNKDFSVQEDNDKELEELLKDLGE